MKVAQKLRFDTCSIEDEELSITTNNSSCDPDDNPECSADFGCPGSQPRKLSFSMDCNDSGIQLMDKSTIAVKDAVRNDRLTPESPQKAQSRPMAFSPPYKRVRALRLFDSPATPKTLMEKSAMHTPISATKCRLFSDKPRAVPMIHHQIPDTPHINVNPFTPNGILLTARKRSNSKRNLSGSPDLPLGELNDSMDSEGEMEQSVKRVAVLDTKISRYHQDFHELGLIGTGDFGSVYKCINRTDGCTYAIKKIVTPVAGSTTGKAAFMEVYAHSVLNQSPHPNQHVVRYCTAWAEDNHMIIQNEYCNGGSLADAITNLQAEGKLFSEAELRQILLHVAEGLRYIHGKNIVHLDIKPGNIFISKEKSPSLNYDSADDGFDEEETVEDEITYKIGDFGHVIDLNDIPDDINEGDCRYLANEVMNGDYSHLTKADIFSLGLTVYEAGGGGPLPKNGEVWCSIRENGKLPDLPHCSRDLNDLIRLMVHPDPKMRPSAVSLIKHRVLSPSDNKSKAQLRRELNAEKLKNEILQRQLQAADKCLKAITPNMTAVISSNDQCRLSGLRTSSRILGKSVNRSNSTTNF